MPTSYTLPPDPLGHREELPIVRRYFPRGFPLILRTNSEYVAEAGCLGWEGFAPMFDTDRIELRVAVHGDESKPTRGTQERPVFRAQHHLLTIRLDADNYGVRDMERCFGLVYLTPPVARNLVMTSFFFLRCMAFVCLGQRWATRFTRPASRATTTASCW